MRSDQHRAVPRLARRHAQPHCQRPPQPDQDNLCTGHIHPERCNHGHSWLGQPVQLGPTCKRRAHYVERGTGRHTGVMQVPSPLVHTRSGRVPPLQARARKGIVPEDRRALHDPRGFGACWTARDTSSGLATLPLTRTWRLLRADVYDDLAVFVKPVKSNPCRVAGQSTGTWTELGPRRSSKSMCLIGDGLALVQSLSSAVFQDMPGLVGPTHIPQVGHKGRSRQEIGYIRGAKIHSPASGRSLNGL